VYGSYDILKVHQRYRKTDGQTDIPQPLAIRCFAVRLRNVKHFMMALSFPKLSCTWEGEVHPVHRPLMWRVRSHEM